MSDTLALESTDQPRVFSVSEITRAVRGVLEEAIGDVWVEGEVSNYRKQASGHQYFTLKDAECQLSCVLFARGVWRKQAALADGMQVRARGKLTVYEARGQYQLNVQSVEAAGAGLLQAKFEALKRRLHAEGLFDEERKRPLPRFPATVALVTSPTGAALRDMLNIFTRRAPWLRLIVAPVRVQGDGSAEEIAAALAELNEWEANGLPRADVIVVGRGGGSAEDLWEFNEEIVARAVVASAIPVVSAVGHEIDFTICDFAADLRAPTPSAAAELIAPDGADLSRHVTQFGARLERQTRGQLDAAAQQLDLAAESLARGTRERLAGLRAWLAERAAALREHRPDQVLRLRRQSLAALAEQLARRFATSFEAHGQRLARAAEHLRLLSPEATLLRGYSITSYADGAVLTSASDAKAGDKLITRFADGEVPSRVESA
ncbi:MAG: exodeoxyribonuclease VII large subunit [Chthoniobacteraceae bacterium]